MYLMMAQGSLLRIIGSTIDNFMIWCKHPLCASALNLTLLLWGSCLYTWCWLTLRFHCLFYYLHVEVGLNLTVCYLLVSSTWIILCSNFEFPFFCLAWTFCWRPMLKTESIRIFTIKWQFALTSWGSCEWMSIQSVLLIIFTFFYHV